MKRNGKKSVLNRVQRQEAEWFKTIDDPRAAWYVDEVVSLCTAPMEQSDFVRSPDFLTLFPRF